MPIHVELVTQEEKVFDEPAADMVVLPGSEGEMGVLPNHAPVLTTLDYGELIVRKGGAEERFVIYGGVVDIRPNKVVILAELAESSFDLDLAAVEAARESAANMLEEGVPEAENRAAALALRRAELALRIGRKMQQRSPSIRIVSDNDGGDEE